MTLSGTQPDGAGGDHAASRDGGGQPASLVVIDQTAQPVVPQGAGTAVATVPGIGEIDLKGHVSERHESDLEIRLAGLFNALVQICAEARLAAELKEAKLSGGSAEAGDATAPVSVEDRLLSELINLYDFRNGVLNSVKASALKPPKDPTRPKLEAGVAFEKALMKSLFMPVVKVAEKFCRTLMSEKVQLTAIAVRFCEKLALERRFNGIEDLHSLAADNWYAAVIRLPAEDQKAAASRVINLTAASLGMTALRAKAVEVEYDNRDRLSLQVFAAKDCDDPIEAALAAMREKAGLNAKRS